MRLYNNFLKIMGVQTIEVQPKRVQYKRLHSHNVIVYNNFFTALFWVAPLLSALP